MLAGLATIEEAVRTMVILIDGIGRQPPEEAAASPTPGLLGDDDRAP